MVNRKNIIKILVVLCTIFLVHLSYERSLVEAATIKLNTTTLTLKNVRTYQLKVKNTKKKVKWSTSNKSIVTVSSKGKVTAVKKGTAYVYARVSNKKLKCKVRVLTTGSITLSKTSLNLRKGKTYTLKPKLKYQLNNKVKWSSSNTKVATVSSNGKVTAKNHGTAVITAKATNNKKATCKVMIKDFKTYKVDIPTYSQHKNGYPKGCEGVSLYMAMRGKGYLEDMSLKEFMNTMPRTSSNPNKGFVGDPTKNGSASVNIGKRTTINPQPLTAWGSQYGQVINYQGKSISELKREIRNGNPIVVYVTVSWKTPNWKKFSWGKEVTNNHAVCLVGYNELTGEYLINDCGRHLGTYWVSKSKFESIYNARKYAVVVE